MTPAHFFWGLDLLFSYVTFGLAIYAIGAVFALILGRTRNAGKRGTLYGGDYLRAQICVVALVLLDASQQVWDSFHAAHFPLWITRSILPPLYLILGNAIARIARSENEE